MNDATTGYGYYWHCAECGMCGPANDSWDAFDTWLEHYNTHRAVDDALREWDAKAESVVWSE